MRSIRVCGFAIVLTAASIAQVSAAPQAADKPSQGSSSSREAHGSSKTPKQGLPKAPDHGSIREGTYRNATFGFSYRIPYGWVERTQEMRATPESDKALVLLAAFERPPEATGDSVNSAVIITAESLLEYPGLDRAVDYFDVLDEITRNKGFKVLNEPYEFPIGSKMLARGDYVKQISQDVSMYQGSLVLLEKGHVVSFTFLAGSEDELESLIMDLRFAPSGARSRQ
jgi:hypothetical protein